MRSSLSSKVSPTAWGQANSFATIFSKRGEILHNPFHHHLLEDGDIVVHDSGAESPSHYASDITRTIPASGKFDSRQRDVYAIVLDSQQAAIDALAPGTPFRDLHATAARVILAGLAELGIITGNIDEALAADAHTLFFPCGLGHMMGLDVHDMEAIGEETSSAMTRRSSATQHSAGARCGSDARSNPTGS